MTKEQFLFFQKFFAMHAGWRWFVNTFAAQVVYVYVLLPLFLVWSVQGRQFMVMAGAALVVAWGAAVQLIAFLFPVQRPYQKYNFVPVSGKALFSRVDRRFDAFPSGHTTALTVLTLMIGLYNVPLAVVSGCVVILTATCRVLLGYHYVVDVLAGLLIGMATVAAFYCLGIFAQISAFIR